MRPRLRKQTTKNPTQTSEASTQDKSKSIPLAKMPKKIDVIDQDGKVASHTIAEIEAEAHFTWTESMEVTPDFDVKKLNEIDLDILPQGKANKIFAEISENTKKLALQYDKETGFRVVTKERLKAGAWIASYTGELATISEKRPLSFYRQNTYLAAAISKHEDKIIGVIDAKKRGNFGRFFQDLPDEKD